MSDTEYPMVVSVEVMSRWGNTFGKGVKFVSQAQEIEFLDRLETLVDEYPHATKGEVEEEGL